MLIIMYGVTVQQVQGYVGPGSYVTIDGFQRSRNGLVSTNNEAGLTTNRYIIDCMEVGLSISEEPRARWADLI